MITITVHDSIAVSIESDLKGIAYKMNGNCR